MILPCKCSHAGQDALNGKGKRVHNETKAKTVRCTVCGDEKTVKKEVK